MQTNDIYFYTATILNWYLLQDDRFKNIIIDSLFYLVRKGNLKVYGFEIMPNHIHLIWSTETPNGKETATASFMKFTAHKFLELLKETDPEALEKFKVDHFNRDHQFWQRNSLPIKMFDRKILEQKLDYIHLNPLQEHWQLVTEPSDYYFSSCSFYEQEDKRFNWLTHYMDVF